MKHSFVPRADDCHVRTTLAASGRGQPFAMHTEAALCRLAVSMVIAQHLFPRLLSLPHTQTGRAVLREPGRARRAASAEAPRSAACPRGRAWGQPRSPGSPGASPDHLEPAQITWEGAERCQPLLSPQGRGWGQQQEPAAVWGTGWTLREAA